MKKRKSILIAIVLFIVCSGLITYGFQVWADTNDNKIGKGVFIDTVDVGGMTVEQAQKAVSNYIKDRKNSLLTVKVDNNTVVVTLKDLGYEANENNHIEDALMVGKSGNLIKRYKEVKDTEEDGLVYNIDFLFDESKLQELVEVQCSAFDIAAKNATMKRDNGEFIITDHEIGRKVVVDETIEKIKSNILTDWNGKDIIIEAVIIDDIPLYKRNSLEKINNVLGSFETTYGSSSASRANNLAVGAEYINGTLIYPGEIFSAYEYLSPFTVANNYSTAGAYSQGKVIDSIGGGVCQVSTTLYNAVLRAELEIVERAPHSMSVGYVKLSADAAIAGTYKDLKFKNNTETPIFIQGYTAGRTINFTIYGEETRDTEHRKIEFVSEVISTTPPPKDVITEDPTKPITYRAVTQSAHTGAKAKLYKVVYQDGVEVSRVLINSSSYAAAPAYVVVGTKEEVKEEEETKEVNEEEEVKEITTPEKDKKGNKKGVKETKKPIETEITNPKESDSTEEKTEDTLNIIEE